MKQLLLVLLVVFISSTVSAQKKSDYYIKWEGVSKEGHIIYGISYTKEEAQYVIDDFNVRNQNTKYKIVYQTLKKRTTNKRNLVRSFYEVYPKKYRVLRTLDIASLHIFQVSSFEKAVEFLKISTNETTLYAEKYLHQLLKEYQLYRLEERKI